MYLFRELLSDLEVSFIQLDSSIHLFRHLELFPVSKSILSTLKGVII